MQRSLIIAAALASVGASAFAQSSVTLYGRINTSIERQRNTADDDNTVMASNISFIGVRGSEDLGNGLKAGFNLEHELNSNDGTQTDSSTFWNRASEVNLSSNSLGMVRLGNFISEAYYATADSVSLHNHDAGSSADRLYINLARGDNKVAYRTPTLYGLTVEAAVNAAQSPATDRAYDLAVNYNLGALHAGLGYTNDSGDWETSVSAKYTFGVPMGALTVGGYVQYVKLDPGLGNRKSARLSAMYAMGNTELHANFGMAGSFSNTSGTSAKQATVAVNQNLSKRTKVYAFATKLGGAAGSDYADDVTGIPGTGIARSFGVGVRHSF